MAAGVRRIFPFSLIAGPFGLAYGATATANGIGDVDGILLRGFDPLNDAVAFGRELIPRIRAGAAAIDAERGDTNAAE